MTTMAPVLISASEIADTSRVHPDSLMVTLPPARAPQESSGRLYALLTKLD